ncbi:unnamed protein product [Pleuronectes platessa]|uniref:Uncharacterized protein n=1 Tax=Pleuronectes platessa TaxID=8262 RepID=A0A9N7VY42_PLEPL|nr:unnamed protein product [Pleuronectes platessa]
MESVKRMREIEQEEKHAGKRVKRKKKRVGARICEREKEREPLAEAQGRSEWAIAFTHHRSASCVRACVSLPPPLLSGQPDDQRSNTLLPWKLMRRAGSRGDVVTLGEDPNAPHSSSWGSPNWILRCKDPHREVEGEASLHHYTGGLGNGPRVGSGSCTGVQL